MARGPQDPAGLHRRMHRASSCSCSLTRAVSRRRPQEASKARTERARESGAGGGGQRPGKGSGGVSVLRRALSSGTGRGHRPDSQKLAFSEKNQHKCPQSKLGKNNPKLASARQRPHAVSPQTRASGARAVGDMVGHRRVDGCAVGGLPPRRVCPAPPCTGHKPTQWAPSYCVAFFRCHGSLQLREGGQSWPMTRFLEGWDPGRRVGGQTREEEQASQHRAAGPGGF